MVKLLKFLLKLVIIIAVILLIVVALARLPLGPVSNVAKTAETELLHILDKNAYTKRIAQNVVDAESEALAKAMDVTTEQAKQLIANVDFFGWTATTLPEGALATKTISGTDLGIDGSITLYSSQDYVTVSTSEQSVTLEVPETAKKAVSYLYFL